MSLGNLKIASIGQFTNNFSFTHLLMCWYVAFTSCIDTQKMNILLHFHLSEEYDKDLNYNVLPFNVLVLYKNITI